MTTLNIIVENDADFYHAFQYKTIAGAPISLAGASMEMMLRRHADDETAYMRLATDTGEIVIFDAAAGKFTVFISQDNLAKLGLGDFAHSNIMTQGGLKTRLWSGTFTNNAGPTR